ncbi:MAG: sulfatase [Anaerolineae bacterium]|jgi:arylsulfatase A-like enzyme|nr:sulfatase [Anaerolineae bacterium]
MLNGNGTPERPHIIGIIVRDLGDWLGCYGRPDVESPALDALAAQGAVLEMHFSPAPSCSAARASIMTGRHPQSHGILGLTHRGWRYRQGEMDLPEILGRGGYHTALIGVQDERQEPWDLTFAEADTAFPDAPAAAEGLSAEEIGEKAVAWLANHRTDAQPFFLLLGFADIHRPYGREYDEELAETLDVPAFLPDTPLVRADLATFYERIKEIDAAVARVLNALDDLGLSDDAVIFVTTDHGPEFPRAKMTLYDPGIKAAFICRWPGRIPAGRRLARLTSHVDVLPTVLDIAGLGVPARVEGGSFLRRLRGERGETRDAIFAAMTWHGGEYDPMRCVRTWRYKFIRNYQPGWPVQISGPVAQRYGSDFLVEHFATPRPAEELYDLVNDPGETRNLIEDPGHEVVKDELADRLGDWMATLSDPILRGPISAPDRGRTGSGSVWAKAPTHEPSEQEFRWAILRTKNFGEDPIEIER